MAAEDWKKGFIDIKYRWNCRPEESAQNEIGWDSEDKKCPSQSLNQSSTLLHWALPSPFPSPPSNLIVVSIWNQAARQRAKYVGPIYLKYVGLKWKEK